MPLVALPALLAAACGDVVAPQSSIDLSAHGVDTWRGLSLRGDTLHLVAEGRGILELDRNGALVGEHKVGEAGLLDAAYRDVAALDAAYVLLADDQGWLYDPATESEIVHFCVLPGDIIGPVQKQRNDAVAIHDDVIYASPRFYDADTEALLMSELRTYRLSDGEPTGAVSLAEPLELQGLAVSGDAILGVHGDRVVKLDETGRVLGEVAIDGVRQTAGIAVDAENAYVLDGERDSVAIVPLAGI